MLVATRYAIRQKVESDFLTLSWFDRVLVIEGIKCNFYQINERGAKA